MNINYYVKSVYGKEFRYAIDSIQADAIRKITGKVTIGDSVREGLMQLGYTFTQVLPPVATQEAKI